MKKPHLFISLFFIFVALLNFTNCGSSSGKKYTVTISWDENHESLVNNTGGGYRVYCSREKHFSLNDSGVVIHDIPYESGLRSPTSTEITLTSGTWYIKVAAYMDLNGTVVSSPSAEQNVSLP